MKSSSLTWRARTAKRNWPEIFRVIQVKICLLRIFNLQWPSEFASGLLVNFARNGSVSLVYKKPFTCDSEQKASALIYQHQSNGQWIMKISKLSFFWRRIFVTQALWESLNKVNSLYSNLLDFCGVYSGGIHSDAFTSVRSLCYVHCFLELATLSSFLFKILFADKSVGNDNLL